MRPRALPDGYEFFLIPDRQGRETPSGFKKRLYYCLRTPRRDLFFHNNYGSFLALFIANPGHPFSREDLFECLYANRDDGGPDDIRTVYYQMLHLMQRLDALGIELDLEIAPRSRYYRFHGLRDRTHSLPHAHHPKSLAKTSQAQHLEPVM